MIIQIACAALFIVAAVILRYLLYKQPQDKTKSGWIGFILAVLATTVCTLISNGEPQNTVITGFATMLIGYNILSR